MANIGTISFDVTANISGLEMAANSTNTKLESIASTATRVSDSLGKAGKKMTAAVTAPALAVGGLAINEFAKFETAMNNVNVIARESDADFANTTESIKDMAIEMGKQPVDLADALFNLNSAGFKGKAGLDVLNVASKSAVGGLVSTELAAKSISSSLNAYGLSSAHASDAADVLFKTNELGVTTFAELASNMGKVLPTANSLGVDLGQVGAAMATMTRGGIGTAEATTSLNQVLLKILKPTKEMGDVFAATEHKTGAAMIAAEGLSGVLKLVRESAIAAGEGAKPLEDGLGKLGFTETALLGINSLLRDNMQEFTNDLEAVATSAGRAGAAQDAFDKNSQGVARRLAELKALVTVTAIEIADVLEPAFTASVETVRSVVAWFRNLDESYRTIIVSAVAVAAAVGPILVGLGFLVGLIPSIIAGFTAMSGAVAFLSGIAPVALAVVAAIAAVGFAVKQVADEFDLFGESAESNFADWETIWERMKALPELFVIEAKFAFENFFAIVDNVFGNIGIIVVNWWNETAAIFDFMGESWENVLSVMSVTFDTYIDNISKRFGLLKDLLTGNIGIGDFAKQFGELQLNPFKGLTENIKKELAIEIPVKVPLRDLGSELAAIADRKDAALEAAMAINTEAISHQTEKTEEAAMAAEEQAASGSGVGAEAMATAEQSAAAVEENYIQRIEQICSKEDIDTIFPSYDAEVFVFAKNKERFAHQGITIVAPEYTALTRILDKSLTLQAADTVGFPCPSSHTPQNHQELMSAVAGKSAPWVLKPRCNAHGVDICLARDLGELETTFAQLSDTQERPLLQEYVPARTKRNYYLLVSPEFEIVSLFSPRVHRYRRVGMRTPCAAVETTLEVPYTKEVRALVRELGIWGAMTVQTIVDERDGIPKLMEINPRFGHNLWYRTEFGINEPLIYLRLAQGRPSGDIPSFPEGVLLLDPLWDVLHLLGQCLDQGKAWLLDRFKPSESATKPYEADSIPQLLHAYRNEYFSRNPRVTSPLNRGFFSDPLPPVIRICRTLLEAIGRRAS